MRTHGEAPPPPPGPHWLGAVTAADGRFELLAGEPGRYEVGVTSAAGRKHCRPLEGAFDIPDAPAHRVAVVLAGTPITGMVVDKESRQPLASASVRPAPDGKAQLAHCSAETGPDGRFEIDVEPGEPTLTVSAKDHVAARYPLAVGPEGIPGLQVELPRGLEIEGRVTDGRGRPVADAGVSARSRLEPADRAYTRTADDGRFRLTGLVEGSHDLSVETTSLGTRAFGHVGTRRPLCGDSEIRSYGTRHDVDAGTTAVGLRVRPGGCLRLRILGPDGTPVPDVRPRAYWLAGGAPLELGYDPHAWSDVSGLYHLSVPSGSLEL